jgi:hypothetical protein
MILNGCSNSCDYLVLGNSGELRQRKACRKQLAHDEPGGTICLPGHSRISFPECVFGRYILTAEVAGDLLDDACTFGCAIGNHPGSPGISVYAASDKPGTCRCAVSIARPSRRVVSPTGAPKEFLTPAAPGGTAASSSIFCHRANVNWNR